MGRVYCLLPLFSVCPVSPGTSQVDLLLGFSVVPASPLGRGQGAVQLLSKEKVVGAVACVAPCLMASWGSSQLLGFSGPSSHLC